MWRVTDNDIVGGIRQSHRKVHTRTMCGLTVAHLCRIILWSSIKCLDRFVVWQWPKRLEMQIVMIPNEKTIKKD